MKGAIHFNETSLNAQKNSEEILKKIAAVIRRGIFFHGSETKELEKNLGTFLGKKGYLTTVASCHDALTLTLLALELKRDDEILFPANATPTAFPISLAKGKPVPVDVDTRGQIDPKDVARKITNKTKALILVHLYGLVGNVDEILKILKRKKITLVEDCAQAFGTLYKGRPVGTLGEIACFSFYPTKNLATLGDGGVLFTKSKKLHTFFLKAKSYGEKRKYYSEFLSGHSRMPEIQAGILNVYLKKFNTKRSKQKKVKKYYLKRLTEEKLLPFLRPFPLGEEGEVLHLFVAEVKKRDALRRFLKQKNIPTFIHYPHPVHLLPAFSFLNKKKGDFPMAERLSKNILSLPFHSFLTRQEIDYIVTCLKQFYHG